MDPPAPTQQLTAVVDKDLTAALLAEAVGAIVQDNWSARR